YRSVLRQHAGARGTVGWPQEHLRHCGRYGPHGWNECGHGRWQRSQRKRRGQCHYLVGRGDSGERGFVGQRLVIGLEGNFMFGILSVRGRLAPASRLALLLLLPLALTGCGVPSGKVSGQVVYQDKGQEKALPGGIVTFRPIDTTINPVTAEIGPDGNYEATVP